VRLNSVVILKIMKKNNKYLSYDDLAWTEAIITSPDEYRKEVEPLCKAILDNSKLKPKTLLHLGCGAGGYDYTFKKYFNVTGVDIGKGMLKAARHLNNDVKYIYGDMRDINLKSKFDIVAIPDSIGYMTSVQDLRKTINTAYSHLKIDGILLIVAHMRENFKENNFVYTGSKNDIDITIFENNFITNKTNYEATIIYLIRCKKKLQIFTDVHTLGLFNSSIWDNLLKKTGFSIKKFNAENIYDNYILQDGEYPQIMFVCKKLKSR